MNTITPTGFDSYTDTNIRLDIYTDGGTRDIIAATIELTPERALELIHELATALDYTTHRATATRVLEITETVV